MYYGPLLKRLKSAAAVFVSVKVAKMSVDVPKVKLNDGLEIPIIGLGTWKSKPNEVKQAVLDAINGGYRHIDCAWAYDNEHEVGAALEELYAAGTVKREDLFITSKLWNTFHRKERVPLCIADTLKNLKTTYVDLYLIHWPVAFKESGDELAPKGEDGQILMDDVDYLESWKALEQLVKQGQVRSIGLSNFNSEQIKRILAAADIKPTVNQVECHPYLNQKDLLQFCKDLDIVLTAYSPLGSPDRFWVKPEDPSVLEDETLKSIAQRHGKSVAQIAIRYQIQRRVVVIPKSVTKSRIIENIQVFNFTLTDEEMATIDALNKNYRALAVPWVAHSSYYPFNISF